MNFCTRCGRQLEKGEPCSCSATVAEPKTFRRRTGMNTGETSSNIYERGQLIVPQNIAPSEGEVPVKQYNVAVMKNALSASRIEGRMQVTNKRVLFRATGSDTYGRTMIQHEFAIDEIAGIEAKRNKRVSGWHLLLGLIIISCIGFLSLAIAAGIYSNSRWFAGIFTLIVASVSCIPFFRVYEKFLIKLLSLSAGAGMVGGMLMMSFTLNRGFGKFFWTLAILFMGIIVIIDFIYIIFKPNLIISVKNKGSMGVVDIKRKSKKKLFGGKDPKTDTEDSEYDFVMPTPETDSAIREIGAIVLDIQKLGDFGVEKWTNK